MPKFEMIDQGGTGPSQITLMPVHGDLRYEDGRLERYNYTYWSTIGLIEDLFTTSETARMDIIDLQYFREEHKKKEEAAWIAVGLEQQFPDLEEAGVYMREMEGLVMAARTAYKSLTEATKEKLKTFEALAEDRENRELEDYPF